MKKIQMRAESLLLALLMLLSLLPMSVFAAQTEDMGAAEKTVVEEAPANVPSDEKALPEEDAVEEVAPAEEAVAEEIVEAAPAPLSAAGTVYSGDCGAQGSNVKWTLNTATGLLEISGTGAMKAYPETDLYDYNYNIYAPRLIEECAPWRHTDRGAQYIKTIHICSGVTLVTNYAFRYCGCTSIVIDGAPTIKGLAFEGCRSVTTITINSGSADMEIPSWGFADCAVLKTATVTAKHLNIGTHAFEGSGLETMILNVQSANFSSFAFRKSNLKSINLPANSTFYESEGSTSPSQNTFDETALEEFTIPAGVKEIGYQAFYYCTKLKTIHLNSELEEIRNNAFEGCGLTSLTLPASLKTIGAGAFMGCRALKEIQFAPDGLRTIGACAFADVGLSTISLPDGLLTLGEDSVYGNNLTCVILPASIQKINVRDSYGDPDNAFRVSDLYYLGTPAQWAKVERSLKWGREEEYTIHYIKDRNCFVNVSSGACEHGKVLPIPCDLEVVNGYTFPASFTMDLGNLTILGVEPDMGYYPTQFYANGKPIDSGAFEAATGGSYVITADFAPLRPGETPRASGKMTGYNEHGYWVLYDDGTLYIVGAGQTPYANSYLSSYLNDVKSVVIYGGFTKMQSSFENCKNLTSVTFNGSVISIDYHAFSGCTKLASVVLPEGVLQIDHGFMDCTALTSVTLPDSLKKMNGAFDGCTKLKSITLPVNLEEIGGSSFQKCTALTKIDIPGSVTIIDDGAFEGCTSLKTVTFHEGLEIVGDSVFDKCDSLRKLEFPRSLKKLGQIRMKSGPYNSNTDSYDDIGRVYFSGDIPEATSGNGIIFYIPVEIYYPKGNSTYTSAARNAISFHSGNSGKYISWKTWTPPEPPSPYDYNTDGKLNILDLACLFTYLSTGENGSKMNDQAFLTVADVNNSGDVNILDYQALYKLIKK